MGSCLACGGKRLRRDKKGRRKCPRHGYMPCSAVRPGIGWSKFDQGGNLHAVPAWNANEIKCEEVST